MADDKKAQSRNTSPEPVKAEPNAYREKTYQAPNPPEAMTKETQKLPKKEAEDKVEKEMPAAADEVRKRL